MAEQQINSDKLPKAANYLGLALFLIVYPLIAAIIFKSPIEPVFVMGTGVLYILLANNLKRWFGKKEK